MKLTIFIGSLSGGGAERVACNLASSLASHGHNVEMLIMAESNQPYSLDERVTKYALLLDAERKNKVYNTIVRFYRLYQYVKKSDADCFVVMLPITTIMMLLLHNITKAKIIASERVDPANNPRWTRMALKHLAKHADGYVFQTEGAKAWYTAYIKQAKTTIIPNAINSEFIRTPYFIDREKVIVSAGRLSDQKNFKLLIRAFADVAKIYPEYKLVIYGTGPLLKDYIKLANELAIADKVEFPGYVTNVGERLQNASLFVLTSDYEGMPNALMEAMALGLPCISTDCPCGGPKYLIENNKNGILIPVNNEKALINAMDAVLSNPSYAKKIGENARLISERLAPEKIYRCWENFIEEVVSKDVE